MNIAMSLTPFVSSCSRNFSDIVNRSISVAGDLEEDATSFMKKNGEKAAKNDELLISSAASSKRGVSISQSPAGIHGKDRPLISSAASSTEGVSRPQSPIGIFGKAVSKEGVWESFFDMGAMFQRYNGPGEASRKMEPVNGADGTKLKDSDWLFEYNSTGAFDPENKAAHSVQMLMSTSGMSSFRMRARFHETSTDKERLVVVETFEEAEGTQTYLVDLNKVDASNATLVEGFAMLADAYGSAYDSGEKSAEDVWHTLIGFSHIIQPFNRGKHEEKFAFETRMNFIGGDESTEKFPPEDTSKSASNSPVSDLPVSDFSVSNFSRTGKKGKADDTPVSGFPIAPGAASRLSVFQDFFGKNLVNQKSASLALWVARNLHINTADILNAYKTADEFRPEAEERSQRFSDRSTLLFA